MRRRPKLLNSKGDLANKAKSGRAANLWTPTAQMAPIKVSNNRITIGKVLKLSKITRKAEKFLTRNTKIISGNVARLNGHDLKRLATGKAGGMTVVGDQN